MECFRQDDGEQLIQLFKLALGQDQSHTKIYKDNLHQVPDLVQNFISEAIRYFEDFVT